MQTCVVKVCSFCKKEFQIRLADVNRGRGKYCSIACAKGYRTANSKKVTTRCKYCGKSFTNLPSKVNDRRGKYCSHSCAVKDRAVPIIRKCERCGTEFKTFQNWINRGDGKYCSRKCSNSHKKTGVIKHCKVCGESYYATPRQTSLYCSRKCFEKTIGRRVLRVCIKCGKEFSTIQSKNKRGSEYCSKACWYSDLCGPKNPTWRGGLSFEPWCWKFNKKLKENVRNSFGRRCLLCGRLECENTTTTGKVRKLSVHHVNYDKNEGCNGKQMHLVPLCLNCHIKTNFNREEWICTISEKLQEHSDME